MDRVGKKRKKGMEHKRGTVNAWVAMVWVAGELNSMLNTIWNFFWIERGLGPRWKKKKKSFSSSSTVESYMYENETEWL
jgi:hypothetical protein